MSRNDISLCSSKPEGGLAIERALSQYGWLIKIDLLERVFGPQNLTKVFPSVIRIILKMFHVKQFGPIAAKNLTSGTTAAISMAGKNPPKICAIVTLRRSPSRGLCRCRKIFPL